SKSNRFYRAVEDSYAAVLGWSLRHKGLVAVVSLALMASGYPLLMSTPMEYIPRDDSSEFEVKLTAPAGFTLEQMDRTFVDLERRIKGLRGVTRVLTTIGDTSGRVGRGAGDVTTGSIYVTLVDLDKRDFTQFDVMRDARAILKDYPDFRTAVSDIDPIRGSSSYGFGVDVNLVGPDLDVLGDYTFRLVDRLKKVPGLVDVDTTLSVRKPELQVVLDRDRAADLGVSAGPVASALAVLVGGEPVSTFKESDEQYDVWLRAASRQRTDRQAIGDLRIPAGDGRLIPLGSIASSAEARGPTEIERLNRQRRTTVGGNLDGISTGEAVDLLIREAKALDLPAGYDYRKGYKSRNLDEVAVNFLIAFALSLVFMYMVLAAQFESFTDPVTILLALPLTFPFALLSLRLLNQPMDIYAIFGLFMLVGIVKKNGILQVDYTNELRRRGVPRDEAILEANRTRLRPILMTTIMLVAGMVPIALGRGAGSAARASLANVIIGGQVLSLLPTLLITPVSYAILDAASARLRRRRRGPSVDAVEPEPEPSRAPAVATDLALAGNGQTPEPREVVAGVVAELRSDSSAPAGSEGLAISGRGQS
ncbi:MAG: efflux RND transporter permease subunit, partial [Isosphaeraceae bacterium]